MTPPTIAPVWLLDAKLLIAGDVVGTAPEMPVAVRSEMVLTAGSAEFDSVRRMSELDDVLELSSAKVGDGDEGGSVW